MIKNILKRWKLYLIIISTFTLWWIVSMQFKEPTPVTTDITDTKIIDEDDTSLETLKTLKTVENNFESLGEGQKNTILEMKKVNENAKKIANETSELRKNLEIWDSCPRWIRQRFEYWSNCPTWAKKRCQARHKALH